jgi:hypothetical protein
VQAGVSPAAAQLLKCNFPSVGGSQRAKGTSYTCVGEHAMFALVCFHSLHQHCHFKLSMHPTLDACYTLAIMLAYCMMVQHKPKYGHLACLVHKPWTQVCNCTCHVCALPPTATNRSTCTVQGGRHITRLLHVSTAFEHVCLCCLWSQPPVQCQGEVFVRCVPRSCVACAACCCLTQVRPEYGQQLMT